MTDNVIQCQHCGSENKISADSCVLCGGSLAIQFPTQLFKQMKRHAELIIEPTSVEDITSNLQKFRDEFEKGLGGIDLSSHDLIPEWKKKFDMWIRASILQLIGNQAKIGFDKLEDLKKNLTNVVMNESKLEKLREYRSFIDSINIPVKQIVVYSIDVKEPEFKDQISLMLTNKRRRFDRFLRELIAAKITEYSKNIKDAGLDVKEIKKSKALSNSEKISGLSKISEEIKQLKKKLEQDINIKIEISYGVEFIEFSDRIEKSMNKISKEIDKLIMKLQS